MPEPPAWSRRRLELGRTCEPGGLEEEAMLRKVSSSSAIRASASATRPSASRAWASSCSRNAVKQYSHATEIPGHLRSSFFALHQPTGVNPVSEERLPEAKVSRAESLHQGVQIISVSQRLAHVPRTSPHSAVSQTTPRALLLRCATEHDAALRVCRPGHCQAARRLYRPAPAQAPRIQAVRADRCGPAAPPRSTLSSPRHAPGSAGTARSVLPLVVVPPVSYHRPLGAGARKG